MEWKGVPTSGGYGNYQTKKGTNWPTHRLSYSLAVGPIGDMLVLHSCDNRRCCNPKHLFLGTQADNMKDKVSKGRQARGTTHGMTKFTLEQKLEVRRLHLVGFNSVQISARTGISQTHCKRIIRG